MYKYLICRIIGNSLPPRHSFGNTYKSADFIIKNEPVFEGSSRLWVLNKIYDPFEKGKIIGLLEKSGEAYLDLPFDAEGHFNAFLDATGLPLQKKLVIRNVKIDGNEPLVQEWILRHKSQKIVGVNSARNRALEVGRSSATWTLVLDGGIVITQDGWDAFTGAVDAGPAANIAVIPMQRLNSWSDAESPTFDGLAIPHEEGAFRYTEEPQLAFHSRSTEIFDERLRYGSRNKAELLVRLDVPGPWHEWDAAPWESNKPLPAPNRGNFVDAGFVFRLPTDGAGNEDGESRYVSRFVGVARQSIKADLHFARSRRKPESEFRIIGEIPSLQCPGDVVAGLEGMLAESDRRITDKTALPPSGNKREYHSLAPYWSATGHYLDGEVQFALSEDDDPSSGRFDRASLLRTMRRIYGLSIGGRLSGRKDMMQKAAELVRMWFIEETSRMVPSAQYAQMIAGCEGPRASAIVEFRHLILVPYSVRILSDESYLTDLECDSVKMWFSEFLDDCASRKIYDKCLMSDNNIGTWSLAIFCASLLFIGNFDRAFRLARSASIRLGKQIGPLSIQFIEMERTKPLHYSLFNLSAWSAMRNVGNEFGLHLDQFEGCNGESLHKALNFCSENRHRFSDYGNDPGNYDYWMGLLTREFAKSSRKDCAEFVKDPDLGIPPLIFV